MKYRQPGYHDKDYKDEREKRKENDRGPRGPREPRGMAREARLVTRCFQCGHQQPAPESLDPGALCPSCNAPLHCCRNCVHFDPAARFQCREPIPAKILSKTAANACTFFRPETVLDATGRRIVTPAPAPEPDKETSARAAFDALFKKK
ncbi:MAG: hypothetical protein DMF50_09975 [Acidobacteria bacterium]|nr:MAG: hypothetical protein DMF50_09975 [Acidobacteriota bacterium]